MDICDTNKKSWYLIYSKPRQEHVAKANLERQGYDVLLPLVRVKKRRAGRVDFKIDALFPRYLFVRLEEGVDNYSPIRSTIGVSHLVSFGHELVKVPLHLISHLQASINESGVVDIPERQVNTGDKCKIVEGIMAGYEAIVLNRCGRERVKLLLQTISNNSLELELNEDLLELVS